MAHHDEGFFNAKDNLRLFWESDYPDAPRAHVGILHGYGDHCGRYRKVIGFLVSNGLAVHAFDYRGHGQADGRRGFCDQFSQYLDDLELFWARVRQSSKSQRCFLLAHSHGALVTLRWLVTRSPEGISGLVLSSPWLKLGKDPPVLKVFFGKLAGKVIPWLPVDSGIGPDALSRDPEAQRATENDPLFNRIATPRWYNEATGVQAEVRASAPQIRLPVLIVCGEADQVSSTPTSRAFFSALGSADKEYKEYPGMRHEVLNEIGKEQVWAEISSWISKHL